MTQLKYARVPIFIQIKKYYKTWFAILNFQIFISDL